MKLGDIFKNSLKYPFNDWVKIIMLGVLSLLTSFGVILPALAIILGGGLDILTAIGGIISFIATFIIMGYCLKITKTTINGNSTLPEFNLSENLNEGLKSFIVAIGYGIIPLIIVIAIGVFSGALNGIIKIVEYAITQNTINGSVPTELVLNALPGATTTLIIGIILGIIYLLITSIAIAKLAKTNSIKEAFNIKKVVSKINEIGWGKYIGWYIITIIISLIIGGVSGALNMIPIIGTLIGIFFINPYLQIVIARSLGLIYKN